MTDQQDQSASAEEAHAGLPIRDEEGRLNPALVEQIAHLVAAGAGGDLRDLLSDLHEADMGALLEALEPDQRVALVRTLGDDFDYTALTEVDDTVRIELMEELDNADIARGVAELDSDDAVYILEDLEKEDQDEILAQMPVFERLSLKRSLDFPEESAGRRMQTEFVAIPPFWTVGQTIDYLRNEEELPDDFYQIYVVDPAFTLMGTIPLDRILRAQRVARIADIMTAQVRQIQATEDQEVAAHLFERYDLVEVAVVDDGLRLVGVLTIDDIVDVIHEEAGEDIHRLGGVGDEEISDRVIETVRSRIVWLLVNLGTATLASIVIGLFTDVLEARVALAVLMPIVASMGGVAGTQTMTVTVRAIASRQIDALNVRRLISRELLVGLTNGVIFAVLLGTLTGFRFFDPSLGVVIGLAMVMNMVVAGACGILIPLALDRLKIDPAIASSTFVMTITDVIGFFAFLGLAGLWFNLF